MRREIKFRVWDKINKKLITPETGGNINLGLDGKLYRASSNPYVAEDPTLLNENDFFIMQFTGLKDSKEKNIYDGDIIEINYYGKKIITSVEIHCTEEGLECEPFNSYSFCESGWEQSSTSKIIGNIYQNPELLET